MKKKMYLGFTRVALIALFTLLLATGASTTTVMAGGKCPGPDCDRVEEAAFIDINIGEFLGAGTVPVDGTGFRTGAAGTQNTWGNGRGTPDVSVAGLASLFQRENYQVVGQTPLGDHAHNVLTIQDLLTGAETDKDCRRLNFDGYNAAHSGVGTDIKPNQMTAGAFTDLASGVDIQGVNPQWSIFNYNLTNFAAESNDGNRYQGGTTEGVIRGGNIVPNP